MSQIKPPGHKETMRIMTRTTNIVLFALPLLVSGTLFGDDTVLDPIHPPLIETLQVTASAREQSVLESATAVTVVGNEQLRQRRANVLPEALRGEVGTWFQQTTPGQGTPVLRGLKGSQVLNLVDGMRLNNAFFRSAPSQYLALVDSMNVSRLEVVRGPSPTLYGHDAMGGVVNVITPTPSHRREWSLDSKAYVSLNSAEQLKLLHAELEAGGPTLAMLGGVTLRDTNDRRVGGGEHISPSGYSSRSANAKMLYTPAAGHEFMLGGQFTEQDSTPRVDELIPGYGQLTPSSEEFFFEPNSREFVHGRYQWTPGDGVLDNIQIHVARQVIQDDRRTREYGSELRVLEQNRSTLDGLKIQAEIVPYEDTFLTLGIESYQDEILSARQGLWLDTGDTEVRSPRFPDGATMDSLALYTHGQASLAENWTLGAGLRYSRFTIQAPASQNDGFLLEPSDLTGNLSVGYEVRQGLRFSANAGRGFRPPNIYDLGTLGPRPGNRFNVANTDLQPESVITLDAGVKYSAGAWELELYAWQSRYRDQISSMDTGEITPEGRIVVRSENLNEVNLHGLESGFRYYGTSGYSLYGTLNWTRGQEYSSDGLSQPADRIPPLNGKLGLDLPLGDTLEADVWMIFAGHQDRLSSRDVSDPRINPLGTSGWGSTNLSLRWQARDNLVLGFRLENLVDKDYREHGSGVSASGLNVTLSLSAGY